MRKITSSFTLTVAGTLAKRVQVTRNIFLAMFNFNFYYTKFLQPVAKPRVLFYGFCDQNHHRIYGNFRAATQPRASWDSTFNPMQLFSQSLTVKRTLWPKTKNLSGRPSNLFLLSFLPSSLDVMVFPVSFLK